ncbi:MAG: deoxynucleoside kinase [candidate division Zixibacteria bacterium]|nr:deoxynucleoside kinase [candidate division Zixibacteria bacterium]
MQENSYIAVEGAIGVGKTSLAKLLAEKTSARLVLEQVEDNPFLDDFYKDRARYAFPAQIFFILTRFRQQQEMHTTDLFYKRVICDYIFAKDRIFASINLASRELHLYESMLSLLEKDIAKPDLVIYLQASTETLMKRIRRRDREYERGMDYQYLQELNEAYNNFFFHYTQTPLLVVNTDRIDFVKNPKHLDDLVEKIKQPHTGTEYYVPFGE